MATDIQILIKTINLKSIIDLIKDIPILKTEGFKKYFSNTSWLMVENFIRMGISFFVGIYVARYLGPDRLGVFSFSQSYTFLFLSFVNLGLDEIATREFVEQEKKQFEIFGTVFLIKFFAAFLAFLAIWASLYFANNEPDINKYIIIIAVSFFFQPFTVIDFFFRAKVKSKYIVIVQLIQLGISSICKIVLVLNQASLIWFVAIIILDSVVSSIGFLSIFQLKEKSFFSWKFNPKFAKKLLTDSWPMILSGVVISIYMKIDQIMIKKIMDSRSVGNYAIAVKLSEIWYVLAGIISNSLFPSIIKSKLVSNEHYINRIQKLYDLMVILSVFIALPVSFFSKQIVLFLYGLDFSRGGAVLGIYIWASIFVFLGVASSKWFISENNQKFLFKRTLLGAVINIFLNLFLIPRYGIQGAAFATLISHFIITYVSSIFFKDTRINLILMTRSLNLFKAFARVLKS